MSHVTNRRIRRVSNRRRVALTLAKALGDLQTVGVKPRSIGRRRLGARIMHDFTTGATLALLLFRHPTKKATQGRMCHLSFPLAA